MKPKMISGLLAVCLLLGGCQDAPIPRAPLMPTQAPAGSTPPGVLVVRVIGPLSVLPLGFQLPLNARGLRLVVSDAGGKIVDQGRAISEGSSFTDTTLALPPGGGRTLQASITDDVGTVIAAGQVQGITITSNAFTNVAVVLAPAAR